MHLQKKKSVSFEFLALDVRDNRPMEKLTKNAKKIVVMISGFSLPIRNHGDDLTLP